MNIDSKLTEYKNNIDTLRAIESLEVYRWLISLGEKLNHDPLSKEKRSEKNMSTKLASELIDAADGRGEAVKKRQDTHKMAEANKAFSHFRF